MALISDKYKKKNNCDKRKANTILANSGPEWKFQVAHWQKTKHQRPTHAVMSSGQHFQAKERAGYRALICRSHAATLGGTLCE